MVRLTDLPEELIVEICRQVFYDLSWKQHADKFGYLFVACQRWYGQNVTSLTSTCRLLHRIATPELRRHILVPHGHTSSALKLAILLGRLAADPVAFAPSVKHVYLVLKWDEPGDAEKNRLRRAILQAREAGHLVVPDEIRYRYSYLSDWRHDFHMTYLATAFLTQLKQLRELTLCSDGKTLNTMTNYVQASACSFLPCLESLRVIAEMSITRQQASCVISGITHFGQKVKALEIHGFPIEDVSDLTFRNMTSVKLVNVGINPKCLRHLLSRCHLEVFTFRIGRQFCTNGADKLDNVVDTAADVIDALTPSAGTLRSLFLDLDSYLSRHRPERNFSMGHFKALENLRVEDWSVARSPRRTAEMPPTNAYDTDTLILSSLPASLKRFDLYRCRHHRNISFMEPSILLNTFAQEPLVFLNAIADECSRGERKGLREVAFQPVEKEAMEICKEFQAAGVKVSREPAWNLEDWPYS